MANVEDSSAQIIFTNRYHIFHSLQIQLSIFIYLFIFLSDWVEGRMNRLK